MEGVREEQVHQGCVGVASSPKAHNQGFTMAPYIADQTLGDDASDDEESAVDEHGSQAVLLCTIAQRMGSFKLQPMQERDFHVVWRLPSYMLRLITGDTVFEWTPEEVMVVKLIQQAMISDVSKKGGAQIETLRKLWSIGAPKKPCHSCNIHRVGLNLCLLSQCQNIFFLVFQKCVASSSNDVVNFAVKSEVGSVEIKTDIDSVEFKMGSTNVEQTVEQTKAKQRKLRGTKRKTLELKAKPRAKKAKGNVQRKTLAKG
ncbi:hypothetical protein SELMODRAFT_414302 [Selaginella moellendorffii]|uniref:Uncharacterized protein n=1 Tax=Selaginella moellendorffii TaxID=88036 RepID=D8RSB0_SELML|nr:hypothetical protein SELMODRAFT_414302 [Selaginella moellendorffii]